MLLAENGRVGVPLGLLSYLLQEPNNKELTGYIRVQKELKERENKTSKTENYQN